MELEKLNDICSQVRRDILRMVHANSSGHPGGSLGCVEYFVSLYYMVEQKHLLFLLLFQNKISI